MKRQILRLFACMLIGAAASAQTVVNMPVKQYPLFEISTDRVDATLVDGSATLGADLVVKGGSGNYAYDWTDGSGASLGHDATFTATAPGTYTLRVTDECQCSHLVTFNLAQAGIDNIAADADNLFGLYPNPTRGMIYFSGSEAPVKVSVVALSGRIVLAADAPGSQLNLSSLPAAQYIVCATLPSGHLVTKKIIKL